MGGVGHFALPRQLTVAASSILEVEVVLAILVQDHRDGRVHFLVRHERCSHLDRLDIGFFNNNEVEADHFASRRLVHRSIQREGDVVRSEGNFLAFVAGLQRQGGGLTVIAVDLLARVVQHVGNDNLQGLGGQDVAVQH